MDRSGVGGAGASVRWVRALVVSGAAVGLGTAAHELAGGQLTGGPGVVLGFATLVLVGLSGALLAGEASAAKIVLLVVGGQIFVHTMLSMTCHDASAPATNQLVMFTAHMFVASLVALLLARGERILWALMRTLAFQVRRATAAVSADYTLRRDALEAAARRWRALGANRCPRALVRGACPVRRGPPSLVAL